MFTGLLLCTYLNEKNKFYCRVDFLYYFQKAFYNSHTVGLMNASIIPFKRHSDHGLTRADGLTRRVEHRKIQTAVCKLVVRAILSWTWVAMEPCYYVRCQ